jgi:translocator protein
MAFTVSSTGFFLWLLIAYMASAIGGVVMIFVDWQPWYRSLKRAPLSPPNWVFGVMWFILYTLWGVGTTFAWETIQPSMTVWVLAWVFALLTIICNAAWTPVFFGARRTGWALVLLVLTFAFALTQDILSWFISDIAGGLLLPQLVWLLFAFYLNVYVVWANPSSTGFAPLTTTTAQIKANASAPPSFSAASTSLTGQHCRPIGTNVDPENPYTHQLLAMPSYDGKQQV